ncbi:hypothetical protein PSCICG_02840 [Pseudomonas cichorii]|nr:hypothetical protein PSCICG_02840 [Pseudomonas cichorii]
MIIIVKCEIESVHLEGAIRLLCAFAAHRSDATNYFQMPSVLIDDRPVHDCGHGSDQEDTMGFERAHRSFFVGVTGWQGLI